MGLLAEMSTRTGAYNIYTYTSYNISYYNVRLASYILYYIILHIIICILGTRDDLDVCVCVCHIYIYIYDLNIYYAYARMSVHCVYYILMCTIIFVVFSEKPGKMWQIFTATVLTRQWWFPLSTLQTAVLYRYI